MDYQIIVGLEVHVQLHTKTKLFCGCINLFNPDNPNVQTCPVCTAMPGSLPVMNRKAFSLAMKTAMAINCGIASFTKWDRKQYYYPDLPKAYQISQFDLPFSENGFLDIEVDGEQRKIGIIRAHLEEDAGKNMHDESGKGGDSKVDLNRCGTPLVEIVSEPDMRSAAEAKEYLEELKLLLTYIDVSDCNMQEGSLRCDANVNLHVTNDQGEKIATPIVEVKNLNSFRGVELAIEYEAARQWDIYQETGLKIGDVPKETRGWDAARGKTFGQRGKEDAADYRYFPDPDLVPVTVTEEEKQSVRDSLGELPAARRSRFIEEYSLSKYDASVIVSQGNSFTQYYESVAKSCGDGKQSANWLTQEVLREMNERKISIEDFPITSEGLATSLINRVRDKKITIKSAKEIFARLMEDFGESNESYTDNKAFDQRVEQLIEEMGLALVSDTGELEGVVDAVLAKEQNQKAIEDFKGGKQAAVGALMGQVMKQIKGADAQTVRKMIIEKIQG
jgi:aspartyl-tRNA(Asn)/glutamyl-tRNA(Gln) amidotransferase subunit B